MVLTEEESAEAAPAEEQHQRRKKQSRLEFPVEILHFLKWLFLSLK